MGNILPISHWFGALDFDMASKYPTIHTHLGLCLLSTVLGLSLPVSFQLARVWNNSLIPLMERGQRLPCFWWSTSSLSLDFQFQFTWGLPSSKLRNFWPAYDLGQIILQSEANRCMDVEHWSGLSLWCLLRYISEGKLKDTKRFAQSRLFAHSKRELHSAFWHLPYCSFLWTI